MPQTYAEKLTDPRWQRRRLEVMGAANFTCEECGRNEFLLGEMRTQLTVHHVYYLARKQIWEYPPALLMCLCWPCHQKRQDIEGEILLSVACHLRALTLPQLEKQPIYAYFAGEAR